MDYGESLSFAETDAGTSAPLDALPKKVTLKAPELAPLPPGGLPPPIATGGGLRSAVAIAVSSAVHAGALGFFIFLAPPVTDQLEDLKIAVEMIAESPLEAAMLEPPEAPPPAVELTPPVEPTAPDIETVPEPLEAAKPPEPMAEERTSETPIAPTEPESIPVIEPEPRSQIAVLAPPAVEPVVVAPAPELVAPPPTLPQPPPPKTESTKTEPTKTEPTKPAPKRVVEKRKREPQPSVVRTAPERPAAPVRTAALPPPAAKLPAPPAPAPSANAIGAWKNSIVSRIAANRTYPDSARARGASGTAMVSIAISPGGQAGASLASSSGHGDLDAAALSAVRRAAPFPPPPPGAPRAFSIPFRYGLR